MKSNTVLCILSSIACIVTIWACNNKASAGSNMHYVEMHDIKEAKMELDSINIALNNRIKNDSIYLYRASIKLMKADTSNRFVQR
jgi:hypothetical protein